MKSGEGLCDGGEIFSINWHVLYGMFFLKLIQIEHVAYVFRMGFRSNVANQQRLIRKAIRG